MKNNKNIMQFSAGTGLLILTVLFRYRLLRLFIVDETKKALSIFTRGATKTTVLDETATLANLGAIQFEQRGIYHYRLDSGAPKQFFTVFIVVEPIRGGPKRCEVYRVVVLDKNGQPTAHPTQIFREAKSITGKLTEGIDSDTAKAVLGFALQEPSSVPLEKPPEAVTDNEAEVKSEPAESVIAPVSEATTIPIIDKHPPFVKLTPEQCEAQILLLLSEVSCKDAHINSLKMENETLKQELSQKQTKIDQLNADLVLIHTQASTVEPLQLQIDTATIKKETALREQQKQYEDRLNGYRKTIFMLSVFVFFLVLFSVALLGIILVTE